MDGIAKGRTSYVLVACQVPAFTGVRKNSASDVWTAAGFSYANISFISGSGNYKIGYQSLAGGLVNPSGGCSGATIQVRVTGSPYHWDGKPVGPRGPAAYRVGEHTHTVLGGLGYSGERIAQLLRAGVIAAP